MTGRRQARAATGKVNPDARTTPTTDTERHTIDGVPCPKYFGGVEVVSARWAEPPDGNEDNGTYAGRTLLRLKDGRKRNGCADCDFTHPHWASVAAHRVEKHGAPPFHWKRSRQVDNDQLELPSDPHTGDPAAQDHLAVEMLPRTEPIATAAPAKASKEPVAANTVVIVPRSIGTMQVAELVELIALVGQWETDREWLIAQHETKLEKANSQANSWKQQFQAEQREHQKLKRKLKGLLGPAGSQKVED